MNRLILTASVLVPLVLMGGIGGFFYAYSVSVMPGLEQAPPAQAITAMQAINTAVRNPVFFVTFFLTPLAALVGAALLQLPRPAHRGERGGVRAVR